MTKRDNIGSRSWKLEKIVACIGMIFCLSLFMMSPVVFANGEKMERIPHVYGVDIKDSGESGPAFQTKAIAECGGGSHDMLSHGWGDIYNVDTGRTVVSNGACSQCTKCKLVIVTQGEPGTGRALGYYTTWQPFENLTSYVTVIHQSTNNIYYTSSSTIPGIRFRYS